MINLDLATILFQVANFLAMAVLLYFLLLKPVMARATQRAAEKERLMRELEQEKDEAAETRKRLAERLARAEAEAAEIINLAQEKVEAAQRALIQEAYEEAERIRDEARKDADRYQQNAVAASLEQVLDTIMLLSGAAISAANIEGLHDNLVKRLNDSILRMGQHERTRVDDLRRSLGDRIPTVEISSAQPLTPAQQNALANTLSALADRRVIIESKLDPALVAGMRLRIGDLVIDSSIAGDLAAYRARIAESLKKELHGR